MAAVHCVIIGFGAFDTGRKLIYEYDDIRGEAHAVPIANINPYLVDAPDVVLDSRRTSICRVPEIVFGSMPNDGGHLLLSDGEKLALLEAEPGAKRWVRPFMGADEFINNIPRWCLWLVDCPPQTIRTLPEVARRVAGVKVHRESSARPATRKLAATPTLFGEIRQPQEDFILIPAHSSETRIYIPIGYFTPTTIVNNSCVVIPNATPYHFGVLTSRMHMAWVRYVCGRLESRYRYTNQIVYNNYPWPEAQTRAQHQKIEAAAQDVLDARADFPGASLADMYDPLTMPPVLVKAHHKLDAAVDAAYGKKNFKNDAERVAFLFELYRKYTTLLPAAGVPAAKRKSGKKRPA